MGEMVLHLRAFLSHLYAFQYQLLLEGVDIEKHRDEKGMPLDGAPFHPYKTFSALPAIGIFFIVFFAIVFFAPTGGGYFIEKPNFEEADFLKTPEHIAPVWYYA